MVFAAFRKLFARGHRTTRPHTPRRVRPTRVALEHLEDRLAPALVSWICNTGDWSTPSCWSVNRLPDQNDDVEIDRPGSITVTNGLPNTSILSLRNAETLELVGVAAAPALFTLGEASQNQAGATLRIQRGTLNGSGALSNSGLVEVSGVSRIEADFSNAANATLRALATNQFGGANNLTVANGFTNAGLMEITSFGGTFTSTVTVANGTLTNAATGVIASLPGTGGGRNLSATLTNLGQITVSQNLALDTANRTFSTTSGALDVALARSLFVKGGTATLGVTVFGAGTVLSGAGTVDLGNLMNLQLPSDFTFQAGGSNLTFSGDVAVTGAGRFINQATFQMTSDVFVVNVDNQGVFEALGTANEIQGTFTSGEDSILRVLASRTLADAALTFAQGFTNNGRVELTSRLSDAGSSLTILAGPLVNPFGKIVEIGGDGIGGRSLTGSLTNEGRLLLARELFVVNAGHTFSNITGRIEFNASIHLTLEDGNSVFGDGSFLIGQNNSRLNLAGTHTMSLAGMSFIVFNQGPQLKLVGRVTVNGPGTLIISATQFELTGDIINAPLENTSVLIAWGDGNQINGPYRGVPGSALRIEGRNPGCGVNPADPFFRLDDCGDAVLIIGRDFTNSGPFSLTSIEDVYFALLAMPPDTTLTNDNTITANLGTGGDRFLYTQFVNRGRIDILAPFLLVAGAGADHVNTPNGVIDATIGSMQIIDADSFHNLGTIDIGVGQFVSLSSGVLMNVVGGNQLVDGTFKINQGQFLYPDATIDTNLANIELTGVNARICDIVALCDATDHALVNFRVNGRTAQNTGRFLISNLPDYQIAGDFTNNGILVIGALSAFNVLNGNLINFAGTTLNGPGVYEVSGTLRFVGANIVTNAATILLSTLSSRIVDEVDFNGLSNFAQNNGTLIVQNGRVLDLDTFINAGTVQINNSGVIRPTTSYTQSSGGRLVLNGGAMRANPGVIFTNQQGARIEGSGTIECEDVQNSGLVAPGGSGAIGAITLLGNYTQTPNGSIEINMRSAAEFDLFVLQEIVMGDGLGRANLAGSVAMVPLAPFNPPAGTLFEIMLYMGRSGQFASVTNGYTALYTDPPAVPAGVTIRRN